jgi:hypothetical protein
VQQKEIKKDFHLTTALELFFILGFISEDCVLAGKQYALIKFKRPIGGPSSAQSNLENQLLPKSDQKQLGKDTIVYDNLEDIWQKSRKIINKTNIARIEGVLVDNSFQEAANILTEKNEMKRFRNVLCELSDLYKNHKSTNSLLKEIT